MQQDKNIFIYYDDLLKMKRPSNLELNIIINLTNYKNIFIIKKKLEEIKNKITNKQINIKSLFIISYYFKELLPILDNEDIFTYISFADEENFRVEISQLSDEYKKHIVGATAVNSGVGIVFYKMIGIKNLIIETPLLNDEENLKLLQELEYNNLFVIPNRIEYQDTIDPNWIRPEAVSLYKKYIKNYILAFDDRVNVDTVVRAYISEKWIGKIRSIVTNIDIESELANVDNILSYTFDKRRMNCHGDCHRCIKCSRDINYINRIKNLLINKEDE